MLLRDIIKGYLWTDFPPNPDFVTPDPSKSKVVVLPAYTTIQKIVPVNDISGLTPLITYEKIDTNGLPFAGELKWDTTDKTDERFEVQDDLGLDYQIVTEPSTPFRNINDYRNSTGISIKGAIESNGTKYRFLGLSTYNLIADSNFVCYINELRTFPLFDKSSGGSATQVYDIPFALYRKTTGASYTVTLVDSPAFISLNTATIANTINKGILQDVQISFDKATSDKGIFPVTISISQGATTVNFTFNISVFS